ncbi:MAG: transglycosylase SLT domain-containing protein [Opitutaceae bacterium]|nr:transglycosylase SLT domain-containing protein [Opitutaceae bacterium]
MIAALVIATAASGPVDVPTIWLDRTRFLESTGRNHAVGKAGEHGPYQIKRSTWKHYSKRPWRTAAHDPVESRRVARMILRDCMKACRRDGRPITFANVRHYYRRGGF